MRNFYFRSFIVFVMLLALGVGEMWGYTTVYLKGDMTDWYTCPSFSWWYESTNGKFYIPVYTSGSGQHWRLYTNNEVSPYTNNYKLKVGDASYHVGYNGANNFEINDNAGIINVCIDQTSDEWSPYVWLERPTIKFKHPWNGGDWTEVNATDNNNGTYQYKGQYGGTAGFNAGPSGDLKYKEAATTVTGSPAIGDRCLFKWDASGYKHNTGEANNTGSFTITKLCAITYEANGATGGTVPGDQTDILYNASTTVSSNSGSLAKTGYTFAGWNTAADGSGTNYTAGSGSITPTATTTTLYAKWTQIVELDKNGGSGGSSNVTMTYNSSTLTGYSAPSKTLRYFGGYWTDETNNDGCGRMIINEDGELEANVEGYTDASGNWIRTTTPTTLHAQWSSSVFYRITFQHNGHGTIAVGGEIIPSGGKAMVYAILTKSLVATPNLGYHFTGWTVTGTGAGRVVIGNTSAASTTINSLGRNATVTAGFAPDVYTITYNLNGGTGESSSSYTIESAAITLPTPTYTGYDFEGWYDNSSFTGSAVTTIAAGSTGNKEYWAKWSPATLYFTTAGNWSLASNWTPAFVPTAVHDAIIRQSCTVNTADAVAKSVVIDKSGSNNGQLIIDANKALNVEGTITKTTTGEDRIATTPSDLILLSSSAGNASLVFDNSYECQATVQMYSKAVGRDETWNWQYVGTPFTGTIATPNYDGSWLYRWKDDCSGWEAVFNENTIDEWVGYCLTQPATKTLSMEGTLLETTSATLEIPDYMKAGTPKVFANSWTAPIQIKQLSAGDFENADATIYLFNTGNDKDGDHEEDGDGSEGTYYTIPIGTAGIKGLPAKIPSMQGFYIRKKTGSEATSLTLSYADHVRLISKSVNTIENGPMYAPKRETLDEPQWIKINAKGSRLGANLYLFAREDFTCGFDNGWDGENINSAGASPLLYSPREDGTKDAVSAIPQFEGAVVGFQAGEDSEYTFSFTYEGDEEWYLNDLQTWTSTRISAENTYTFLTTDDDETRFIISAAPLAKMPQDIDNNAAEGAKARKMLIRDKLYIIRNGRIYDGTGKMVSM